VPSVVHLEAAIPVGHEIVSHAPEAQVRSHLHESWHWMSLQALVPEQVMLHCESLSHVTSSHAPSPMQLIVHVQPSGHLTLPQLSSVEQFIVQVFADSLQLSQSDGQFGIAQ